MFHFNRPTQTFPRIGHAMNSTKLMKTAACICLAATLLLTSSCKIQNAQKIVPNDSIIFYVSPDGNDAWTGTFPEPDLNRNTGATDGPFKTLQKAQEAVRNHPKNGVKPIAVKIRKGFYQVEKPWTFTPEDTGKDGATITWTGFENERPVISGGRILTGWKVNPDGTWSLHVPEAVKGNQPGDSWNINQLFVNGQRRQRARLPKYPDIFRMDGRPTNWGTRQEAYKLPGSFDQLVFHEKDIAPCFTTKDGKRNIEDVSNAIVVIYNSWTASIHHLEAIDFKTHRLHMTKGTSWPVGHWDRQGRYHIENVRAALTDPGEWYMDHATGTLHYIPMPGETPDNVQAIVPVAPHVLHIQGDAEAGIPVSNLVFKNISFQHNIFDLKNDQRHDGQAASSLRGAVLVEGATKCRFENIDVRHIGTYGVEFAEGSRHNILVHSEITDMGGGGVRIGERDTKPNAAATTGYNTVENCFIHDGGLIAPAAVGAIIFRSSHNILRHNEICDLYYSAVSIGWSWGYAPSTANNNIVEYNHLHHLGYGFLSDMGAVYTLGISPGTIVRGNHIHDIFSYSYGGWGLYTDEGSTDVVMENNLVYNTKSGGFHQHYGKDNIIRNNILAFSQSGQAIRSRIEKHRSFTFENNVVVFDNGRPYGGNWSMGENILAQNNLYWDVTGLPFGFNGIPADEWFNDMKQEAGTIIADPKFKDPKNFDFTLLHDSPAKHLATPALEAAKIAGLTGDEEWKRKPLQITFKKLSPDLVPVSTERPIISSAKELIIDFKDYKPGDKSPLGTTAGENETLKTSIRVTDEIDGPNSKNALKFVDAPNQRHIWQPHLVYRHLRWRKGTVVGEFDVYLNSPDAVLWHEWRDSAAPYKVGPCIRLRGNGSLEWGEKKIAEIPLKTWIHVKITAPLSNETTRAFDLEITPGGKPTQTFKNLGYVSNDWLVMTKLLFVSESDKRSDFYVANIKFINK